VFIDVDGVALPAPAPRFDRTPAGHPEPPVRAGKHTINVLEELGLDAEEITELSRTGVIG
jgi:alpha-methylacyl-CoA racemase